MSGIEYIINEIDKKEQKEMKEMAENINSSEEEDDESELEILKQNNIKIYKILYPPIKESFTEENNINNNKILKLKQETPDLRYKKAASLKNNTLLKDEEIESKNIELNEEELEMNDKFLDDLIKVPCPISKSRKIAIISNFIRKSKLIEKLENEYQSDKKADLNNLSILCAENLSFIELKKGEVVFKIGEIGDKFFFVLKGFVSILKLKEKNMIRMSYYDYFNYCIKLLKENEIYILEETLKANFKKIPFKSIEIITKLYKLIFKKKLYENINRQVLYNNKVLTNYFSLHEQKIENFGIDFNELKNLEQTKNIKEWRNYLLLKTKPSKEDLDFLDYYERFYNNRAEIFISYFCLDPFLYLGPGFFFGDSSLEKMNSYAGGKRNATIRAETDVILGWMKGVDYSDIIEPKRRMEKLKEIGFLFNNFFFQEISIHLFEKNYFHLFSALEYSKGDVLFNTGVHPLGLFFIKEGKISLEIKTSITNLQKLIQYIYEYTFTSPIFMGLSPLMRKKLIDDNKIKIMKRYLDEPIFKKIKGFSQKFVDELDKDRKYNIAILAGNEAIGLEEIFLGTPYIMKATVISKKVNSYEISVEHLEKILFDEKQIIIPYIKSSINKIFSLIERLQNIKSHYLNYFIQKYEKGLDKEKIGSNYNIKNEWSTKNINNNQININSFLKTENSVSNINDKMNNNIDSTLNKYNQLIIDRNENKINTIYISNNKSPLKKYFLRPKSKKNLIKLVKLKKNQKSSLIPYHGINLLNNNTKNNTRNYFNLKNNKFENNKISKTSEQFKSLFDINNKNEKDLLIGDKYFSLEKLRNKFNEIDLHNYDNRELIQVIQSTKYNTLYNNKNNDLNNNINSFSSNNKHKKETILRGKQKFLNFHLSYVPLNNLNNKEKELKTTYDSFSSYSKENTYSSQKQNTLLSLNSTKDNTKSNTFRNRNNSRNYLNINNNNFSSNYKTLKSDNKENIIKRKDKIFSYNSYNVEKYENEKYIGNIKEKIKDFYKEIKSKGCLSFLSNAENNMFFMRKFNKKYISAIKNSRNFKSKTIEKSRKMSLPEIKEFLKNKN